MMRRRRRRRSRAAEPPVFADEAVVKVATALDTINPDWEQHLCWPKAQP
ncbi:MAG: hypothetical protein JJE35_06910 [Thermoleophilia bacterium]|nr:hypothetical protein [Thermoleophilia bacterium]